MVNELRELMRGNVGEPPPDHLDLGAVIGAGRRRVRARRRLVTGGAALAVAAVVATGALLSPLGGAPGGDGRTDAAAGRGAPPAPDAPTISLADAEPAVEGRDYEVLTSITNENLNRENGEHLEGATDDGLVLLLDAPRRGRLYPVYSLLDPATGERDELPRLRIGQAQAWPLELSSERLVLLGNDESDVSGLDDLPLVAHVFDRGTREWRTIAWPGLPPVGFPAGDIGPDGRLYVGVPATQGGPPPAGWPEGEDGEADDSDAPGDTHRLWSVSLDDPDDARDEGLTVGEVAFTQDAMVWTDGSNGEAGQVHVRDLATGEETSFDPRSGERCNLLSFGASDDRIVMGQYCGGYDGGVRDDRVQVLSTSGEQVVTVQASGIDGSLPTGSDVVPVQAYGSTRRDPDAGYYAYDLATDRLLKLADAVSNFSLGGPAANPREVMWHVPVNKRRGSTQYLGRLLD